MRGLPPLIWTGLILSRFSHAGTHVARALPSALKRMIRIEIFSRSAKALLPPHTCKRGLPQLIWTSLTLSRFSHAGTDEARALPPALKRMIRIETLSRSAKALLPPHTCKRGLPQLIWTSLTLSRFSHAGTHEALALPPALKRMIRIEILSRSAKALLLPHTCKR